MHLNIFYRNSFVAFNLCVPYTHLPLVCHTRHKHYNYKYRWHRGKKFWKPELPDFKEMNSVRNFTPDEMRRYMKEKGILPPVKWDERPITISCSGSIFEAYQPPESDGKMSIVSGVKGGAKNTYSRAQTFRNVRKIRSYEPDFKFANFAVKALDIYKRAHEALAAMDEEALHATVTETAYMKMTHNMERKTVVWRLEGGQLEPARAVQARCNTLMDDGNMFGQVTVRLHTQQTLAVYDRFGRLMYGSEARLRDVLEYVVFEKHLSDLYGTWRLHDKIVVESTAREPARKTWRFVSEPEEEVAVAQTEKSVGQPSVS